MNETDRTMAPANGTEMARPMPMGPIMARRNTMTSIPLGMVAGVPQQSSSRQLDEWEAQKLGYYQCKAR